MFFTANSRVMKEKCETKLAMLSRINLSTPYFYL